MEKYNRLQEVNFKPEAPHVSLDLHEKYRFTCTRCGLCCGRPGYFTPDTLEKAAKYVNLGKQSFFNCHCRIKGTVIRPKVEDNGYCTFYSEIDEIGVCSIHPVKPRNCHYSPLIPMTYTIDIARDYKISFGTGATFALLLCDGHGKGKLRKVGDTIKKTEMPLDLTLQSRVLLEISVLLGPRVFINSPRDGKNFIDAVSRVYGV